MKACWECAGISPRILDLVTRWRWVVSFTLQPLYPPKERAPVTHWIGGWVSPSVGLDAVVKREITSPFRVSNPPLPIIQPVAQLYTTGLSLWQFFFSRYWSASPELQHGSLWETAFNIRLFRFSNVFVYEFSLNLGNRVKSIRRLVSNSNASISCEGQVVWRCWCRV
jgi:hypothetical protein